MVDFPILSVLTFLPLIGVFFLISIRGDEATVARNSKNVALFTSVVNFVLSLYLYAHFDAENPGFQFVEKGAWLSEIGIGYHMGIDGISIFFVLLAAFLTPICVLISWNSITKRVREYMIAFLVLDTFMIGTFCALDAILFYIFFEGVLIPMFLIIGVWGGPRRVYASYKFFLYTLFGSVLMFLALLVLYVQAGTTDIPTLMQHPVAHDLQIWLWLAVFVNFAIKMPMWPVHTWLRDAHVEAPTAGSVVLASVLLKIGGYGFLRFSLPMFPEASEFFTPMVFTLSIIAIIYASLVALVQQDMKRLIAYSSVAHMGFVTLGLFSANQQGIEGAVFQMISHGVISGALFLCVGIIYDRLHTRDLYRYGGLVKNMPRYATLFMILVLGSVGLPGTSGFVGEFLVLVGAFQVNMIVTAFAASGAILGAAYMLWLYRKVVFGAQEHKDAAAMSDINARETWLLLPFAVLTIYLGVFPMPVLDRIAPSIHVLVEDYQSKLSDEYRVRPAPDVAASSPVVEVQP